MEVKQRLKLLFSSLLGCQWDQICAKFRHLGKMSKIFDNFSKFNSGFGNDFEPPLAKNHFIVPIGIVVNGQIMKNNLGIRSHCWLRSNKTDCVLNRLMLLGLVGYLQK